VNRLSPILTAALLAALPPIVAAQTIPPNAPSPVPSATPAPPSDYCTSGGLSALVSRPTQTNSVCVVPKGHVEIETGFQSQTVVGGAGAYTDQSVPNAALRFGTPIKDVELQLLPPTAYRADGTSATGDAGVGAKWQIASYQNVAFGVSASTTVVTGTNPLTNPFELGSATAMTQNYNAQFAWQIGKVFGLAGGVQQSELAAPAPAGPQHYASTIPSLVLSAAMPASWNLFGEVYAQSHGEGPGTPTHTWLDAGVSKDVGNAQLDLNWGHADAIVVAPGLPSVSRHYVGAGFSYEF